jgi:hypothetical protein
VFQRALQPERVVGPHSVAVRLSQYRTASCVTHPA